MLNRNVNFLARFLSLEMDLIEFLLNVSQNVPLKILLATINTLKTWNVIHNKKFIVVSVNILGLRRLEMFMPTENTTPTHHEPRSNGFLNFGGVGI
jgi:hypothetical protein